MDPDDLLAPNGPVEPELFPGEGDGTAATTLFTRLARYIERAAAKTEVAAAQRAYALYLTFHAAYIGAIARPSDIDLQVDILGREGFDEDQREGLLDLANGYLAEYESLVTSETGEGAAPRGISTHSIKIVYDY